MMNDSTADFSATNADSPPQIPDFDLLREIGHGSFGRVWLATNRATGQRRAVKTIPRRREGTLDPAGREIVSITRLEMSLQRRHPNLLAIHHVGQTADHLFYVMDLADDIRSSTNGSSADYQAATLERRLAAGPLEPELCLVYTRQLLAGLASLHEAGMVHRDVKPANCLFVDGELKLADFGLLTEAGSSVSRLGTEKYMPPDGRMDARADVYAAGLVVYEMLTGLAADRFPWLGHAAATVAADSTLSALMRIALAACQPKPEARFRNAGDMLAAIGKSLSKNSPRSAIRRRFVTALAVASIVGPIAAASVWWKTSARVNVNFITDPFDATIFLDGRELTTSDGSPAQTPCTVDNLPPASHHVIFRHPQYKDLDVGLVDFRTTRQVTGRWPSPREDSEASTDASDQPALKREK